MTSHHVPKKNVLMMEVITRWNLHPIHPMLPLSPPRQGLERPGPQAMTGDDKHTSITMVTEGWSEGHWFFTHFLIMDMIKWQLEVLIGPPFLWWRTGHPVLFLLTEQRFQVLKRTSDNPNVLGGNKFPILGSPTNTPFPVLEASHRLFSIPGVSSNIGKSPF